MASENGALEMPRFPALGLWGKTRLLSRWIPIEHLEAWETNFMFAFKTQVSALPSAISMEHATRPSRLRKEPRPLVPPGRLMRGWALQPRAGLPLSNTAWRQLKEEARPRCQGGRPAEPHTVGAGPRDSGAGPREAEQVPTVV